ncbi:SIP domain-containing protein [Streptomyces microflavus]
MSRDGAPAGTTDLLEQAVRSVEWLPGTVCVRAAGEAVTLKGIRRHIAVERQVPRERSHFTGYWRRTELPPRARLRTPRRRTRRRTSGCTNSPTWHRASPSGRPSRSACSTWCAAGPPPSPGRNAAPGRADPAHRPGRHRRNAPTPAGGLPVRLGAPLAGRAERPGGPGRPAGAPMRRHRLGPPAVGAGALCRTVTPGPAGTGVRNGVMRARCGRVAGPATGFRPARRAA